MARYVFITGGVVSSLGKGLASAALGALLQARGYRVRLRKLDPYLNIDPGTMSPFEHGEVYVTDDGAETDLDLGHYERFTGVKTRRSDSVSAGHIYSNVLEKERKGQYLGKTIQVVPHVTDEIKEFLRIGADEVDFMLCEIGGTVGDIEGLPFFEAIRQFGHDMPAGACIFVHLTLLPYVAAAGELKTKPTQHSVKELQSLGITPNVLVCRSERPIPANERAKIALFCNVRKQAVVPAYDLGSIYEAPLVYHRAGLDRAVLEAFAIRPAPALNLARWEDVKECLQSREGAITVAIVGKYTRLEDAYQSIREALVHGGLHNRVRIALRWLDAEMLHQEGAALHLRDCHALLVPGGFGVRGVEGMMAAIQYARETKLPYLGICLGMQLAVIEAARHVGQMPGAGSEEFAQDAGPQDTGKTALIPMVYHLKEWVQGNTTIQRRQDDAKGGTMRLGSYDALLVEGSLAARIYRCRRIEERHRHRYEVDMRYRETLEKLGLRFSGTSPDGRLPEIVEWRDHPWFIGVQFHPELKSKPFAPHPLFRDFVRAAKERAARMSRVPPPASKGEERGPFPDANHSGCHTGCPNGYQSR
ncbi:MAG: CTP synthase [Rhodobacteraceae bacterium]|nr:CTP synthase [Paracoccaceae bacterium]